MAKTSIDYKTQLDFLRKGSPEELAAFIADSAKVLNQRYRNIEKAVETGRIKKSALSESAYYFGKIQTGKDKPRYSVSAKQYLEAASVKTEDGKIIYNNNELYKKGQEIIEKLSSPSSTLKGLDSLYKKRLESSYLGVQRKLQEAGIPAENMIDKEYFKEFIEAGGSELLKAYDSTQVLEKINQMYDKGLQAKELTDYFKDYVEANNRRPDYGTLKRDWTNLVIAKRNREKAQEFLKAKAEREGRKPTNSNKKATKKKTKKSKKKKR